MEKIKKYFSWFMLVVWIMVSFIPKRELKEQIQLVLLIIIFPFIIGDIIKSVKENDRKTNLRIVTSFVMMALIFLVWYFGKE